MNLRQVPFFLALSALPFSASHAGTQSFDGVFSWVGSGSDTITLSQFDSTLGTLTSVTVAVTTAKTGGLGQADNDSAIAGNVIFTQKIDVAFNSTDVRLFDSDFSDNWSDLSAASSSGSRVLEATTGDDTIAFNNTGLGDYTQWNATDASDLSASDIANGAWNLGDTGYIGTGNFNLLASGTQSTTTSGLGGVQTAQVVSNVSGTATVTYTYDAAPIPEPGTYALIAGLCAFGWIAIRRRR
jgi:hypothetical protein